MSIIRGDSFEVLADLELDDPVSTVVTSPPYLAQRRYGDDPRELGLEHSVDDFVERIVHLGKLLRPFLAEGASWWLNLGDKSNNSGGAGGDWKPSKGRRTSSGPGRFRDPDYADGSFLDVPGAALRGLLADGWRLRLPIVWDKGREAPESLQHANRPRWAHEMIFLLAPGPGRIRFFPSMLEETGSVWHFPPGGSGPAHLAPYPDELARRCILPTTLPGDLVLDPFAGSGTTLRVAEAHGRRALGIDLYAGEPLEPVQESGIVNRERSAVNLRDLAELRLPTGTYYFAARTIADVGLEASRDVLKSYRVRLTPEQERYVLETLGIDEEAAS